MTKQNCFSRQLVFLLLFITLATHAFAQQTNVLSSGTKATSSATFPATQVKEEQLTAIPFVKDSLTLLIVVSVQVNGHDPMPFIVDTGLSQPIVIEKWAADQLKLVPSKEHLTFSPGNRTFPVAMLQNLLLKGKGTAPNIEYDSLPACIVDFDVPSSSHSRIAGTLGLPLFSKFVMQLDFSHHVINLSKKIDRSQLDRNAVFLLLTQPDPTTVRFYADWSACSSTLKYNPRNEPSQKQEDTKSLVATNNLLIDTGSDVSSFPETMIFSLHPAAMSAGASLNLAGISQNSFAFIPTFALGSFVISDLAVVSLAPQQNPPSEPVIGAEPAIGMDILEHFRVTLDFPGKQIILDKFDNKASTSADSTTGIRLKKQKAGFFTSYIQPRSPAQKAFIQIGDKVTRIDGLDLAGHSLEMVQQRLDGNVGTKARMLIVSENGKPRQVTLSRLTFYDPSLYPNSGFILTKRAADQAILVKNILCSSPAWKAGVRVGDVLVAVNGTPIKTGLQARSLLNAWPKKVLTLKMQRDGKPQAIILK